MIKLVVFDWNGTLFSDVEAAVHAANARMKFLNRPAITSKQFQDAFEIPAVKTYTNLGIDPKLLQINSIELSKTFHDAYESRARNVRTRAGAREVLTYLENQKISKIIFSNHTVEGIKFQINRLKIAKFFNVVLANENIYASHHNGKKHRLEAYLKTQNFKSSEVIIVGDSPEEVNIGKDLGLKTVAITGGFCSTKRLKASKPDVLIHKLRDIINIIEEI